jgi:hypothetical protein
MKSQSRIHVFQFNHIIYLVLMVFLISTSIALAADKGDVKKGDGTANNLSVMTPIKDTELQFEHGIDWSKYTKYQITPVDVSFRKNWKRDYNNEQMSLSTQLTDKDVAKIREGVAKIVYDEFDKMLQKKGGLTKVETADSNTLIFKPVILNLDVYAPDVGQSSIISKSYIRQAGKATLLLEVRDAMSGKILARWVDTREDPDQGYYEWANRVTNTTRAKLVAHRWASRLVDGLDKMKAID